MSHLSISRRLTPALSACLCACLIAAAPAAGAQPAAPSSADQEEETAQQLLKQGRKDYARGRTQKAYEAFRAAWDLRKTEGIGCNLGQAELALKKHRDAAEHLQWCLAQLPDPKPAQGLKDLAEAKSHVVTLQLETTPAGATVQIDGVPLGTTPLAQPLFLEVGTHKLELFREGHQPVVEQLEGAAGSLIIKRAQLRPLPARTAPIQPPAPTPAKPEAPGPQPEPEPSNTKLIVVIGGAALTLGAVVAGAVYRFDARSEAETRDRLQADVGDCFNSTSAGCQRLAQAQDDYASLSNTSTAFFGVGGGLALLTLGAYLFWPAPEPAQHARIGVGFTANRLLIQGEF